MLTLDWTKNIKPWLEEDEYFYTYSSVINPSNYSDNSYLDMYKDGLLEMIDYFNKVAPDDITPLLKEGQPHLFDPRSQTCSYAYYLISIDKDLLESLDDKSFEIPEGTTSLKISYTDFIDLVKSYDKLIASLDSYLSSNDKILTNSGNQIKLGDELFAGFRDSIDELMADNHVFAKNLFLELYFTNSYFLSLVIYDNSPMSIGMSNFAKDSRARSVLVNGFLSNRDFVDHFISTNSNKDEYYDWGSFIGRIKGVYDIKIEKSTSVNTAIKNAIENGPIANVINDYKDQAKKDLQNIMNPVKIEVGGSCGKIDGDYLSKVIKSVNDKGIEDAFIKRTEARINVLDYVEVDFRSSTNIAGGHDFVGDRILANFLDTHSYPKTISDVYKNILNYINMEDLLKKALECIADESIPKICIDVYNPFVFNFPDTFSIDGVFESISDLIISQILFIVQEAIMALMRQILKIIEECEFEDLATIGQRKEELFVDGSLDSNSAIIDNLMQNFSDFQSTKELLANNFYDFAEEVYATLLPTEFCSLINAVPTSKTMMIVHCILDLKFDILKGKLDTDDKIISSFMALRSFFNSDVCNVERFIPSGNDDICKYSELEYAKENLIASMPNLTAVQVEEQLQLIQDLKKNKLDYFSSMLFGGNNNSVVFGDKTPDQFAEDQIPCAADNENLKHMVGVTIDGLINSANSIFIDAAAGSFTNSEFFIKETGVAEYKSKISQLDFVKRSGDHSIKIGNWVLSQNIGTSDTTLSGQRMTLKSGYAPTREFGPAQYWREEEFKQFPYESVRKVGPVTTQTTTQQSVQNSENNFQAALQAFQEMQGIDLDASRRLIEEEIVEKIAGMVKASPLLQVDSSTTKELLLSMVDDETPSGLMFDCWDGNSPLKDSIISKFAEEECKEKDPASLNKSITTGVIDLFVRSVIVRVAYNNFILAPQFGFKELDKSFTKSLIVRNISKVIPYLSDSYIEDFDMLIQNNMEFVTDKFKDALGPYALPYVNRENNTHKLFLESLPVLDKLSESLIRTSLSKVFLVDTELNGSKTRSLYINILDTGSDITVGLIASVTLPIVYSAINVSLDSAFNNLLARSDKYKLMFDYCFPISDYVSSFSIYNLYNLGLNSPSWDQLSDVLLYSLESIRNTSNFTYNNDSMGRNERKKMSQSRKNDGRSDAVRYLSLPWIFDLII